MNPKERLNELHLFAGAGGGILGGMLLGHTCVCAVEIEPYCQEVLLQRQRDGILPRFPIWGDIQTFDGTPYRGRVDIIAGGFPCTRISAAGKGGGITKGESALWKEFRRVIREVRPRFVFIENSPLLRKRGLSVVLRDLAAMGYHARWGVLGAGHAGGPHKRDRMWIVADSKRGPGQRSESRGGSNQRMGRIIEHIPWDRTPQRALAELRGMDDGLARVVDRTNAIRNGQVPIVAALAWRILSQA